MTQDVLLDQSGQHWQVLKLTRIKLHIVGHIACFYVYCYTCWVHLWYVKMYKYIVVFYLVPWQYLFCAENKGEAHCEMCDPHSEAKQSSPSLREGLCTHQYKYSQKQTQCSCHNAHKCPMTLSILKEKHTERQIVKTQIHIRSFKALKGAVCVHVYLFLRKT